MHRNEKMTGLLRLFPLLLLLVGLSSPSPAQWAMAEVAKVSAEMTPTEGKRGTAVQLTVTLALDDGYHLYAMHQPKPDAGPISTSIDLGEKAQKTLAPNGDWKEPPTKTKFDEGFETDIALLYGDKLVFTRNYHISPNIKPNDYTIEGTVTYQACTETSCLPPVEAPFSVKLKVLDGEPLAIAPTKGPPQRPSNSPSATVEETAPPTKTTGANSVEDVVSQSSFGGFLLTSFLLGLLALATPCVFPMIPITITFFTNKSSKSTLHAAGYAATYVLSIIMGFTIIGFGFSLILLASGAGVERSGFANMIAANPWINLFFALLYMGFALSLFEVIHLQLPSSLSSKLNKGAMKSSGILSIFFKAMVFVVISFTCTAPLLGVLIVQALGGAWTRPLFGMMAFSTGFALPFFVLALLPQMLGKLPQAGSWLYATKVVMGMVVLAASFKFVSNSDLIWLRENMIFTREVLLAIWATIMLVIALYLFGMIRLKEDSGEHGIGPLRLLGGTAFTAIALYLSAGLFGTELHPWVEAYTPPDLNKTHTIAQPGQSGNPKDIYKWYDDIEPALVQARESGKNVLIDFSGYTCTNCRLMEKTMFPRPEVAKLMGEYVLVELYTDDPDTGKKWQAYQAKNFNTVTLPFYAIVTPDEEFIAKAEYTRDEALFVNFLKQGLK
jgi:thiol:disulfide interchange protein